MASSHASVAGPCAGLKVLDLFAGTGALGLEALSRGAQSAVFVDIGAEARGIIRDHIEAFGIAEGDRDIRHEMQPLAVRGGQQQREERVVRRFVAHHAVEAQRLDLPRLLACGGEIVRQMGKDAYRHGLSLLSGPT